MSTEWFEVDRKGLSQLLVRKGVHFIVLEPLSNAWDENVTRVDVKLERIPGTREVLLEVADDSPEGFQSLREAYVLYAPSRKKGVATMRGRYNVGEKLVLALADSASIKSTTGTVYFDENGRRTSRAHTDRGTVFSCKIKLNNDQMQECFEVMSRLIPPLGVDTYFNGQLLPQRRALATIEATLQTEAPDDEGVLRRVQRKTTVSIYDPEPGETPMLYELGVPVAPTEDRYHVSIGQKVPLDMERTSVPAAYLSRIRALVLQAMHERLSADDAASTWVKDALHTHGDTLPVEAIKSVTELRFGTRAVAFDPSDREANAIAVSQGYTLVHGGQMSGAEWSAVRRAGTLLPAGRVTPSPKPFSEDGSPLNLVSEDKWTPAIVATVRYSKRLAERLLGRSITVEIASQVGWPFAATYGPGRLIFNLGRLGHKFFEGPLQPKNRLLLHEFAHEFEQSHLSSDFHDAICRLGASLAQLALDDPGFFLDSEATT